MFISFTPVVGRWSLVSVGILMTKYPWHPLIPANNPMGKWPPTTWFSRRSEFQVIKLRKEMNNLSDSFAILVYIAWVAIGLTTILEIRESIRLSKIYEQGLYQWYCWSSLIHSSFVLISIRPLSFYCSINLWRKFQRTGWRRRSCLRQLNALVLAYNIIQFNCTHSHLISTVSFSFWGQRGH